MVLFNWRFPGQFYDAETGLNYNYLRDYNPATGRYLESDPVGLVGGVNTYAYVGGNPVNSIDPNGKSPLALLVPLLRIMLPLAMMPSDDLPGLGGTGGGLGKLPNCPKVDARTLQRTHSIEGKRSTKLVQELADDMRANGYDGPPIDVVEDNGARYILDGHHRAAAARQTGTEVPVNIITDVASHPSSFQSLDEVLDAASSVGPDGIVPRR